MLPYHLRHQSVSVPMFGQTSKGITVRGVVLKTILPDSPTATARVATGERRTERDIGVKCDVYLIEPNHRGVLRDVPVATSSGGVADHETWVPRETTLNILTGEPLVLSEEGNTGPTPTAGHNMDGDYVLVTFLGNDYTKPVIVGQVPHPRNGQAPSYADLTKYRYRRRIRGCVLMVTDNGNVEFDLTEANNGTLVPGDPPTEIPTPGAGLSGNITVTLGGLKTLPTGAKVTIANSTASSPEPVILGDSWLEREDGHLGDLLSWMTGINTALAELIALLGGTGVPPVPVLRAPTPGLINAISQTTLLIAQLGGDRAQINIARAAGLPYLSSHLETD